MFLMKAIFVSRSNLAAFRDSVNLNLVKSQIAVESKLIEFEINGLEATNQFTLQVKRKRLKNQVCKSLIGSNIHFQLLLISLVEHQFQVCS